MGRDHEVVESELVRLIKFLAEPSDAPPCARRFQFLHNELGTILRLLLIPTDWPAGARRRRSCST
jgi:hypothetical protein